MKAIKTPINRRTLAAAIRAAFAEGTIRSIQVPSEYVPRGAIVMVAGEPAEWFGTSQHRSNWAVDFLLAEERQDLSKGAFTLIERIHPADEPRARYLIEGIGREKADKEAFVARYVPPAEPVAMTAYAAELRPGDVITLYGERPLEVLGLETGDEDGVRVRALERDGEGRVSGVWPVYRWDQKLPIVRTIRHY